MRVDTTISARAGYRSKRSEPNQPLFQERGTKPTGLGIFGRFNSLTVVSTIVNRLIAVSNLNQNRRFLKISLIKPPVLALNQTASV